PIALGDRAGGGVVDHLTQLEVLEEVAGVGLAHVVPQVDRPLGGRPRSYKPGTGLPQPRPASARRVRHAGGVAADDDATGGAPSEWELVDGVPTDEVVALLSVPQDEFVAARTVRVKELKAA